MYKKKQFHTPRIVISKCLNFDHCRFNGDVIKDEFLLRLWEYVDYVPVCPEVAIGLGTPRLPVRLYDDNGVIRMYQPGNDLDVTDKMNQFSKKFLTNLWEVDGFVMKNRSPSCGTVWVKVYDKKDVSSASHAKSYGLFSARIDRMYSGYPLEEEGRLKNLLLREEFLTKIFLFAHLRDLFGNLSMKRLIDFHTCHKFFFLSYGHNFLQSLWNIVANHEDFSCEKVYELYGKKLREGLAKNRTKNNIINTLLHIFWYFKKYNTPQERAFFLESLQTYKEGRVPMSTVLTLLKMWAIWYSQEYILSQSILFPFPEELIDLSHSGKHLNI